MELSQSREATYGDYLKQPPEYLAELINGVLYNQAAPSTRHQICQRELIVALAAHLRGSQCEVFNAPFEVRLFEDKSTIVQPDIAVICDKSKLTDWGCNGAPDMVMEILSPGSVKLDRVIKLEKYMRAGVKEYWLVDPINDVIEVLTLSQRSTVIAGSYTLGTAKKASAKSKVFPGFEADLSLLFS